MNFSTSFTGRDSTLLGSMNLDVICFLPFYFSFMFDIVYWFLKT